MPIHELFPWASKERDLSERGAESPVLAVGREMNRLFDEFWKRLDVTPSRSAKEAFGVSTPRVDVVETDQAVEVAMELPGMNEKDIEVSASENVLVVKGEKKAEREEKKQNYRLSERSFGSFHRSIPLPPGTAIDAAKAEFKNGVLTITLPKTPEAQAKVRKIEVKPT